MVEPTNLTEEFNMVSDLIGLANVLPIYYPFAQIKEKKLKLKMSIIVQ